MEMDACWFIKVVGRVNIRAFMWFFVVGFIIVLVVMPEKPIIVG